MKKTSSKRKLNNRGFSLIELIVTLAIIVILAGAAAVTVSMLDSSYVEDAERGIKDYISLGRTKSMSVSASDWYVTVAKEDADYYVYLYKD
ncbi:MAG: prepilin-type N-terminal cleavage/methylation domain-containing protein, partial [Lachnospiraceae bacterium]|nr:prepilin-type N-terminal cleavage/methylation domain-containing protein [Lachnospiraceae bacterium]